MPARARVLGLWLALALGATACIPAPQSMVRQDPRLDWNQTLDGARQAVIAGRYADADSLLTSYAKRHPDAKQAAEVPYWQGLFRLDPGNPHRSVDQGVAALDRYLAGPPTLPHWREATVARRLAVQLDSVTKQVAAQPGSAESSGGSAAGSTGTGDDVKSKDDEIARLRGELAKANEELERIKKRLAAPKP